MLLSVSMIPAVFQDEASPLEPRAVQGRWVNIVEETYNNLLVMEKLRSFNQTRRMNLNKSV